MSADHVLASSRGSISIADLPKADLYAPAPDAAVEPTGAWADHLASVRQASAEEGYRDGHAEGLAAGARAAQVANENLRMQVSAAASAMQSAIAQLGETDRRSAEDLTGEAVRLAFDLARLVLDREIASREDPGTDAIQRCLALVPRRERVVVRLNPADCATLGDLGAVLGGVEYEVVADASVASGGALVEAGPARIDAQLDTALERVAMALGLAAKPAEAQPAEAQTEAGR